MALIFVGGMLVGNFYLPERNVSVAASVAVPDLQCTNPVLGTVNAETARANLTSLELALNACPMIVADEKEKLVNQINLLFALQDFYLKKTAFELEIAKNHTESKTSSLYAKAAADYADAKRRTEQLIDLLFPPAPTPKAEEAKPADVKPEEQHPVEIKAQPAAEIKPVATPKPADEAKPTETKTQPEPAKTEPVKPAEVKPEAKPVEAKPEAKPAEPKTEPATVKTEVKTETKTAPVKTETKPEPVKSVDVKTQSATPAEAQLEAKPAEVKTETKPIEAKPEAKPAEDKTASAAPAAQPAPAVTPAP